MAIVHNNCRLACGVTRTVILVGRLALKFPAVGEWRLFLLGLLANMQERQFGRAGWPELCPVLWSIPGGWLVVMARAREMTTEEFEAFDFDRFVLGGTYVVPVERKADSFGWLDGRVVAIDYGN